MEVVRPDLIEMLGEGFVLDLRGIHGESHWLRVRDSGLRLAMLTGANARVVEAFAYLHDCRRESDGHDPMHGECAASWTAIRHLTEAHVERALITAPAEGG